ncbi:MAG: MFS transporter [Saccharofermentans sp.]|nr:MFS transporter [Saccharofermentans sp.]
MKLNYKRTLCVGFAFFLICVFWQAYDNTMPLILTNKFGLKQTWSGFIMAIDNILALFMLPLFGAISDRSKNLKGKRTPFIITGTIIAVIAFVSLSFVDNIQLKKVSAVSAIDDPAALAELYENEADEELMTPSGDKFVLSEVFSETEFTEITSQITNEDGKLVTNPRYSNYVVPARQAYIREVTTSSPSTLIVFMVILLIALVAMATFRSPAVALMPDVTIKPLRSKANAVINLMGSAGGIIVLALGIVFATSSVKNSMMSYTVYFIVIAAVMLLALLIFKLTVKEPVFVEEMHAQSRRFGIEEEEDDDKSGSRKLTKEEKRSLIFILASIVFWFMGYNAVTSKYSVYASTILGKDYNTTLIIAQLAAIISYLPVGLIASKVGRKKTILAGVIFLGVAFGAAGALRSDTPAIVMNILFALAGIGWATINVNSFPMVVEMCSGGDVGKYTGIYYTASMSAQIITPIFSGFLMDKMGMLILFPYAVVFVALAFVTMTQVRHGDSKPAPVKGVEAFEDIDN